MPADAVGFQRLSNAVEWRSKDQQAMRSNPIKMAVVSRKGALLAVAMPQAPGQTAQPKRCRIPVTNTIEVR